MRRALGHLFLLLIGQRILRHLPLPAPWPMMLSGGYTVLVAGALLIRMRFWTRL